MPQRGYQRLSSEKSLRELKKALKRKVQVMAFGLVYQGTLTQVDLSAGTLEIQDKKDHVVLEINRIESFKELDH